MVQFNKILVCIDLSELDEILINYAQIIGKAFQGASLIFIHIYHKHQSNILFGKAKNASNSADALSNEIKNKLQNSFQGVNINWDVDVLEGDINDKMLDAIKKHDADLLIMGRKQKLKESEGLPKRTVKRAGCSVLLIPEAPIRAFDNILVAVDFSEYSAVAVNISLLLANDGILHCQHVYEVPSGYHRTGKDYHEFAKVMEQNAINDTKAFIKKYKLPAERLKFIYTLDENGRKAKEIVNYAKKLNTGLISIGSKGRTGAASMVLGSVAEDLVNVDDLYPMLVIKKKNENLGFFDVILKM